MREPDGGEGWEGRLERRERSAGSSSSAIMESSTGADGLSPLASGTSTRTTGEGHGRGSTSEYISVIVVRVSGSWSNGDCCNWAVSAGWSTLERSREDGSSSAFAWSNAFWKLFTDCGFSFSSSCWNVMQLYMGTICKRTSASTAFLSLEDAWMNFCFFEAGLLRPGVFSRLTTSLNVGIVSFQISWFLPSGRTPLSSFQECYPNSCQENHSPVAESGLENIGGLDRMP